MAEKSGELEIQERTDDFAENNSAEAEDSTEETEQLKAQIEETRSNMGETIDAIQEKLSLSNITEQVREQITEEISNVYETAKKSVYSATIVKAGEFMKTVGKELSKTDIGKTARNNPFPLFLIGLGIGLLAFQSFSGKKQKSYRSAETGNGNRRNKSMLKAAQNKLGSAYETVSDAANSAYGGVSGTVGSAYHGAGSMAENAYETVGDYAGRTYEKVGEYGTQAREKYDYHIEENPLAVGAVALAVGAAVGFSIPSTKYEGELMGGYRQQVFDKAQTAAGDLVEKVKEVASEAQKTIGDEVKNAVGEVQKSIGNEAKT